MARKPKVKVIIREAKPVPGRTAREIIEATGRWVYDGKKRSKRAIIDVMPTNGENCILEFVKFGRAILDDELIAAGKELGYKRLGTPAEISSVNENDPKFAGKYPNYTIWKDAKGGWGFIAYSDDDRKNLNAYVGFDAHYEPKDNQWWIPFVR